MGVRRGRPPAHPSMTNSLRSLILLASLSIGAACANSDAKTVNPANATVASTGGSANGSIAPASSGVPHDSISDKADRGRITGNTQSKVWVIMLSDFQCPYCKQWHDTFFGGVLKDYVLTNKVQMAFINFPLSIHPNAVPAAEAAMCASVQGRFWPMHDALFANQDAWAALPDPSTKLAEIAAAIPGMDAAKFRSCVTQHQTLPLVMADRDRARATGAQSTPSFFIVPTNQLVSGSDKDLHAEIEAALKAAK